MVEIAPGWSFRLVAQNGRWEVHTSVKPTDGLEVCFPLKAALGVEEQVCEKPLAGPYGDPVFCRLPAKHDGDCSWVIPRPPLEVCICNHLAGSHAETRNVCDLCDCKEFRGVSDSERHVDLIALDPLGSGGKRLIKRTSPDDPEIGKTVREGGSAYVEMSEPHSMAECPYRDSEQPDDREWMLNDDGPGHPYVEWGPQLALVTAVVPKDRAERAEGSNGPATFLATFLATYYVEICAISQEDAERKARQLRFDMRDADLRPFLDAVLYWREGCK